MALAVPVDQTLHRKLLGASDAAAALGLSKFRSPMDVWLRITAARRDEPPPSEEDAPEWLEWGRILEPVVRGKYALMTGSAVWVPPTSFVHPVHQWLRATPDGVVYPDGPAGVLDGSMPPWLPDAGLLQVKTCSAYRMDEWSSGVPEEYEIQVRVEMAVVGAPWCDVVCLAGGSKLLGPYRIHRDEERERAIIDDLRMFWGRWIEPEQPPPVDDSTAWSQYASSKMRPSKVAIEADAETRAYIVELQQERMTRRKSEAQERELRTQILLRLSAAGATVLDGGDLGKITAYQVAGRMDWKRYAEHLETLLDIGPGIGEMRAGYKCPPGSWALRCPRSWGEEE